MSIGKMKRLFQLAICMQYSWTQRSPDHMDWRVYTAVCTYVQTLTTVLVVYLFAFALTSFLTYDLEARVGLKTGMMPSMALLQSCSVLGM